MSKTYFRPRWVDSVPADLEDGAIVIEGMFSRCPAPHGEPVVSKAKGVILRGGNGNNRAFPPTWKLEGCTNAQIKYTLIETEYEANDGTVIEKELEQEPLGHTYAEAVAANPEKVE